MRCSPLHVFFDESGDLGFGPDASAYLVLTALATRDPTSVKRTVKRVKKKLGLPRSVELHAYDASKRARRYVLEELAKLDAEVRATIVVKRNVYDRLREQPNVLYNYASKFVLCELLAAQSAAEVFIDNRVSRVHPRMMALPDYLYAQVWGELGSPVKLMIRMMDSAQVLGVQAVDFVAYAIHRKYELGDETDYNIVAGLIGDEFVLFQGET